MQTKAIKDSMSDIYNHSNDLKLGRYMISDKRIGRHQLSYIVGILAILFNSGGNMFLRNIYVLIASAFFVFIMCRKKIRMANIVILVFFSLYVFVNSFIVNSCPSNEKEFILIIGRLFCAYIIISNLPIDKFKRIFIECMYCLCLFSLLCFGLLLLGLPLPGAQEINGLFGTFYHTIVIGSEYPPLGELRNSGIFTEPGLYQIYINIALLFLLSDKTISSKKTKKMFIVFTITMISTKSSMGYLLYALVFFLYYTDRPEILPKILDLRIEKNIKAILLVFFFIAFWIFEYYTHLITDFVVNTNSFASRSDDTLLGILLATKYPIFGVGLATDVTELWEANYALLGTARRYMGMQFGMSNGLANVAFMGGIPFLLIYIYAIIRSYIKWLTPRTVLSKIIISFLLIMFFMEEPYMLTPFFMVCLYEGLKIDFRKQKELKVLFY